MTDDLNILYFFQVTICSRVLLGKEPYSFSLWKSNTSYQIIIIVIIILIIIITKQKDKKAEKLK